MIDEGSARNPQGNSGNGRNYPKRKTGFGSYDNVVLGNKGIEELSRRGESCYTLRPIGNYLMFHKYFIKSPIDNKWRSAVIDNDDVQDCPVKTKHGLHPKKVFAIHVIDRYDGKLKVLEGNLGLLETMMKPKTEDGEEVSGKKGKDITLAIDKDTKGWYTLKVKCDSTLSDEEMRNMKAQMTEYNNFETGEKLEDRLKRIFKATPVDEIEEYLLYGRQKGQQQNSYNNGGGNQNYGNRNSGYNNNQQVKYNNNQQQRQQPQQQPVPQQNNTQSVGEEDTIDW
jgi:hypothetical protein